MRIEIDSEKIGRRVDVVVSEILKESSLSRSIIQKYINDGCKVNGKECKRSYKLKQFDVLELDDQYWTKLERSIDLSSEILPQEGILDIKYEDEDLIVLNKPKDLVVHPGVGNKQGTLANYLRHYLSSKGEYDNLVDRCGIVHRLDKGVSGLMVVAKNKDTQEFLKNQFKEKTVIKIYHAILEESTNIEQNFDLRKYVREMNIKLQPWKDWRRVEGYIGRDKVNRYRMEFKRYEFTGSKYALSFFLFSNNEALIKIETGRMHQIRATLKSLGYHIQGDSLYGKSSGNKIMLESVLLSFDKRDGNRLVFTL